MSTGGPVMLCRHVWITTCRNCGTDKSDWPESSAAPASGDGNLMSEQIEVLRVNLKGSQNALWTHLEELKTAHKKIDDLCDLALSALSLREQREAVNRLIKAARIIQARSHYTTGIPDGDPSKGGGNYLADALLEIDAAPSAGREEREK